MLSPLARLLFPPSDDTQLTFLRDDNVRIEPEWYCPILPTVLINGCEGIGTGYSTSVPNYDPREIVGNLKRIMVGMEPEDMVRMARLKGIQGSKLTFSHLPSRQVVLILWLPLLSFSCPYK